MAARSATEAAYRSGALQAASDEQELNKLRWYIDEADMRNQQLLNECASIYVPCLTC